MFSTRSAHAVLPHVGITPNVRFGDWVGPASIAVAIVLLASSYRSGPRSKRRRRQRTKDDP